MKIESKDEILELRSRIYENAQKTYNRIVQDINNNSPFDLFADIKFNKFGLDPINGTPLNFIEQLNQMFSDLVVLQAVEELLCSAFLRRVNVSHTNRICRFWLVEKNSERVWHATKLFFAIVFSIPLFCGIMFAV